MNRDEYVQNFKARLDRWNGEAAKLEARAREAQASVKAEYEKQLAQFRTRRDHALQEMQRIQAASVDAWRELARGADAALKSMQEAFEKARASFDRKEKR